MSSINSNTQKKNNNNFIDASQKESFDANKLIVNIGATSFLTGFLGALWAIKRAESKGTYKDLTPKKMAELDEFARYRIATLFTLKTFALGTILCLSTAGLLTIGIGSWLKQQRLEEDKDWEMLSPQTIWSNDCVHGSSSFRHVFAVDISMQCVLISKLVLISVNFDEIIEIIVKSFMMMKLVI
nr:3208_t:CDS:2 [Entrophospora candida]